MIYNQMYTSIGKETALSGNFHFRGSTHLLGKLSGEIKMMDQSKLILEIGSETKALIDCHDAEIYGEFSGEIKASGNVTLYPTAIFTGKVIAKTLEILPGAIVNMSGHTEEVRS
ncbi:MAG: polymer-forming cytoskeletal protein [Bacteriovoracaceae bacterium]|nr:polymer-forming cytoskeletal protein [Bacteriovoracaceae bacterium]